MSVYPVSPYIVMTERENTPYKMLVKPRIVGGEIFYLDSCPNVDVSVGRLSRVSHLYCAHQMSQQLLAGF